MHAMSTMKTIVAGGLLLALGATAAGQDLPEDVNRAVRDATGIDLNAVIETGGMPVNRDGTIDRLDPANQPRVLGAGRLDLETILPATGDVVGSVGVVLDERFGPEGRELRLDLDLDALQRLDPALESNRLTLPIFDGETLELILLEPEYRSADRWSWLGKIAGIAMSDVILVRERDAVLLIARDYATNRGFDLRGASPTEYALRSISTGPDPGTRCGADFAPIAALTPGDGDAVGRAAPGGTAAAAGTVSDTGNVVDVMYVATNQAAEAFEFIGGESAFVAHCVSAQLDFNLRCLFSGLSLSCRIAATYYNSGYDESSAGGYNPPDGSIDRSRIVDGSDGYLDWVHPARNDVAADVVVLFRSSNWPVTSEFTAAGVASTPPTLAAMSLYDTHAYCVSTITGNYARTVSHEIGHMFGACHNDAADSTGGTCNSTITTSPKGFVDVCDTFFDVICSMTTMAYTPDGCTETNFAPIWSSPSLEYDPSDFCPAVFMGDTESNVANLLDMSRFTRAQSRIGAAVKWGQPGASSSEADGTHFNPYPVASDAVIAVEGGVDEGVVRLEPGVYADTTAGAGPLTYWNPCTVVAEGGVAVIE